MIAVIDSRCVEVGWSPAPFEGDGSAVGLKPGLPGTGGQPSSQKGKHEDMFCTPVGYGTCG